MARIFLDMLVNCSHVGTIVDSARCVVSSAFPVMDVWGVIGVFLVCLLAVYVLVRLVHKMLWLAYMFALMFIVFEVFLHLHIFFVGSLSEVDPYAVFSRWTGTATAAH